MKWGHNQLADDLATHLRRNTDRMIWVDMQLGPSGSPRPDVFTAPKSYSKFMPIAYEVKISVSDFRSDITSGKWHSYLQFASGVMFCVPAGLISKADLPKGCGLMIRNEDSWVTVKSPTLSPVKDFPREAWIKLLIDGIDRAKTPLPNSRIMNIYSVNKIISKKYGEKLAIALARRDQAENELLYQTTKCEAKLESERKRFEEEREKLSADFRKQATEFDQQRADFCAALGLEADAELWDIKHTIKKSLAAINRDTQIIRMKEAVKNMQRHLKFATESLDSDLPAIFNNEQPEMATEE